MRIRKQDTRRVSVMGLFILLLGTTACDDPFGPRIWSAAPDTLQVWSVSRPELQGFVSALDLASEPPLGLQIESTGAIGSWDVALIDLNGGLALAPASYFPGHGTSRAAIALITGTTFQDLERAPGDSASFVRVPVPLTADGLYVVRSRVAVCRDGSGSGVHYAKLRPIEIDVAAGRALLEAVNNPFCGDRALVTND